MDWMIMSNCLSKKPQVWSRVASERPEVCCPEQILVQEQCSHLGWLLAITAREESRAQQRQSPMAAALLQSSQTGILLERISTWGF